MAAGMAVAGTVVTGTAAGVADTIIIAALGWEVRSSASEPPR